jgi:hypothetical protein
MNAGLFLIVLGLIVGVLLHAGLGIALVIIGLVLLFLPRLR